MNTLKVKEQVENLRGKRVKIKVNAGRNKYEYYEGEVLVNYPYLFTVMVDTQIKSFSFVDLLTKDVQLKQENSWFI